MSRIDTRLDELGLVLPQPAAPPPGYEFSFEWARVRGRRVFVSGHSPQAPDGTLAGPFGSVPSRVSVERATAAARSTLLSVLGSVKQAIGDLDRISAWLTVTGMVNADRKFGQTTLVVNGFSDAVIEVFGRDIGAHARTAVGYATLPLNNAVTIAAELEIDG